MNTWIAPHRLHHIDSTRDFGTDVGPRRSAQSSSQGDQPKGLRGVVWPSHLPQFSPELLSTSQASQLFTVQLAVPLLSQPAAPMASAAEPPPPEGERMRAASAAAPSLGQAPERPRGRQRLR
eukprot:7169286-Pyramimonas_sp.AAC.1